MCKTTDNPGKFPEGYIKYSFKTYLVHSLPLSFEIDGPEVSRVFFEKKDPEDNYDIDWFMTIHVNSECAIDDLFRMGEEWKNSIFDIWSLMVDVRITDIRCVNIGFRNSPGGGANSNILMPMLEVNASGRVSLPSLHKETISSLRRTFKSTQSLAHKALLEVFRYSISSDDPVVQFMLLYLILYEIYGSQSNIDKFIVGKEPSTVQSKSPHNGRLETKYTRLRNQIAHRVGVKPEFTKADIINELDGLRRLARYALCSAL